MEQQYTTDRPAPQHAGGTGQWTARTGQTIFALFVMLCLAWQAEAQSVSHPLSEMSTTARYYSYTYMLSPTQKKDLLYIIVLDSKGDAKTVFNACDVCYLSRKGYSQSGTELRCNNCGNRFAIDGLGNDNTSGTCNPGYLPHTIENGNVVIQIADLVKGEYYFHVQTVSAVDDLASPGEIALAQTGGQVTLTLPTAVQRNYYVYGANGARLMAFSDASQVVHIGTSGFVPGMYFVVVEDRQQQTPIKFLVY